MPLLAFYSCLEPCENIKKIIHKKELGDKFQPSSLITCNIPFPFSNNNGADQTFFYQNKNVGCKCASLMKTYIGFEESRGIFVDQNNKRYRLNIMHNPIDKLNIKTYVS